MSRENVELIRGLYDAFNTQNYQASLELMAPDVEYHELEGMPGARGMVGIYYGREEVARWFGEFLSEWDEGFQSEPTEITELADGRILVVETWRGRGAQSGAEVEALATAVYTIREGQVSLIRYFATRAEAVESAGLSE
jgi:ketosteroid isomerase-like protein